MDDKKKTKAQLLKEVSELRRRVAELEATESSREQAHEILRERERLLSSVFESIQDGLCILDKDYTIIKVSPKIEEWYAHSMPLIGKKCYEAYHNRPDPCEVCPAHQTIETGQAAHEVVPKRGPDGEIVGWLDLYSFPLIDLATGQTKGVIEYVRDITEHQQAEEELVETRGYLASLIESSADAIISTDGDGNIYLFNKGAESLLGYRRDEVLGRRVTLLYETEERAKEMMRQMREGGGAVAGFETALRAKNGILIPVLISASLLYDKEGAEAGSVGFSKDLRMRKRAEEAVKEAQAFYERLVGDAGDAVVALNRDSKIITWNLGAEKIFGFTAEEVVGRNGRFLVPEDEMERAREIRRKVLAGKTVADELVRRYGKSGEAIDGLATYSPLRNIEGRVVGFCSIFKDITERRRAAEAVREAQAYYENLVGDAGDAIVALKRDGTIITWNTGAERIFGWTAGEVMGKNYMELHHKEVVGEITNITERVFEGKTIYNFETRRLRKDGTWFDMLATISPLRDARGTIVAAHGIIKDITDRKRSEEALSRSARMQTVVAELGSLALRGVDLQTVKNEAVRLAADALGVEMCKILRLKESGDVLRLVAGQGWRAGTVGSALVGAGLDSQAGYTLREGRPVIVEDLRKEKRFSGPPLLFEHGVISGLSVPMVAGDFVYGVMGAHTTRLREFSEDDVHFLESVANVVTTACLRRESEEELKRANEELRRHIDYIQKAQEHLIRAEKLAALGRLTAGVSHEILNPLNIIIIRLHMMMEDTSIPEEIMRGIRMVDEQARRISKITQDLLSFSRQRKPERRKLDFNETVEKTVSLLAHQLKLQNIAVEVNLSTKLPEVSADQDQLQQVVLNLITNAKDAMPDGGRLVVNTKEVTSKGRRFVELAVGDTGKGIDSEHIEKLFDPFFTTKPEGQGTGLGLAICQGIVGAHGGTISVNNAEGVGATFVVLLPLDGIELDVPA